MPRKKKVIRIKIKLNDIRLHIAATKIDKR